ncbi:MAG: hypothetical protein Q8941_20105 [Bacteroidota bacterium]|nr:hypothetical protein [Bacteroidota bacterium]
MRKLIFLPGILILMTLISSAQGNKDYSVQFIDSVIQFVPSTIGPYCPTKLLAGDREFDGHGPEIWAWVKLRVVGKAEIYADVYMHARETVSDWSETEGTWSKLLYRAPRGYQINELPLTNYSEVHYISKPGVSAFSPAGVMQAMNGGAKGTDVPFKDDGLVSRWNIVGDTGGDDISTDDDCNDDTQVAVQLNLLKVKLQRPVLVKNVTIPSKEVLAKSGILSPRDLKITPDTTVQYIPSTIGPYCPKKLLGGDRDFGGHGPEIWASINLRIVSGNAVYADVYMHARETESDWSETEGNWSKLVYTAPAGYTITGIISGMTSEVHYVSKPGANAFSPAGVLQAMTGGAKGTDVPFKDDGLVARWNIVGDTGGDDISTDDNCNDDTQVAIQLNPMKVKLHKK